MTINKGRFSNLSESNVMNILPQKFKVHSISEIYTCNMLKCKISFSKFVFNLLSFKTKPNEQKYEY